jgi:hypothetical protein
MSKTLDIFPAYAVVLPANTITNLYDIAALLPMPKGAARVETVRIVVIEGRIMIVQDSPEGPTLIFQEKYLELKKEGKYHLMRTESGKALLFGKDANCGCGSRLRTWNPFNIVQSTKDNE